MNKEKSLQLEREGYKVLGPRLSNIKTDKNGFIIFEDDASDSPIIIESVFIEICLKSETIIVCNEEGYIGNTVIFEIGYLLAKKKNIEFIEKPKECWISEVIEHFSKLDNKIIRIK